MGFQFSVFVIFNTPCCTSRLSSRVEKSSTTRTEIIQSEPSPSVVGTEISKKEEISR